MKKEFLSWIRIRVPVENESMQEILGECPGEHANHEVNRPDKATDKQS